MISLKNNLKMDIHVLQTMPPSCVNRDDTGSPKMTVYGGVTRSYVSSQCWKHAVREMFRENGDLWHGVRTLEVHRILTKSVLDQDTSGMSEADAAKKAWDTMVLLGLGSKEKDKSGTGTGVEYHKTGALTFLSMAQIEALADVILDGNNKKQAEYKKECAFALNSEPSLDVALFGRMMAGNTALNTDACAQVAFAISTHACEMESDYFSAIDDMSQEGHAGAANLGDVYFNSSTLYRYASVDVGALADQVGDFVSEGLAGFLKAFVLSIPTGKVHSFANQTLPGMVYVSFQRTPTSFVGAFEDPVPAKGGYMAGSKRRLVEYAKELYNAYGIEPLEAYVMGNTTGVPFGKPCDLTDMIANVQAYVSQQTFWAQLGIQPGMEVQ